MSTHAVSTYAQRDVPLPPAPSDNYFSELQWKTLYALADAIVPSIHTVATANSSNDQVISEAEWNSAVSSLSTIISGPDAVNIATQYLQENVSSNPQFRAIVERLMGDHVHGQGRNGLPAGQGCPRIALDVRWCPVALSGSVTPASVLASERCQFRGTPQVPLTCYRPSDSMAAYLRCSHLRLNPESSREWSIRCALS